MQYKNNRHRMWRSVGQMGDNSVDSSASIAETYYKYCCKLTAIESHYVCICDTIFPLLYAKYIFCVQYFFCCITLTPREHTEERERSFLCWLLFWLAVIAFCSLSFVLYGRHSYYRDYEWQWSAILSDGVPFPPIRAVNCDFICFGSSHLTICLSIWPSLICMHSFYCLSRPLPLLRSPAISP